LETENDLDHKKWPKLVGALKAKQSLALLPWVNKKSS